MFAPEGSKDAQGNELHIGTNCLGHYLLYQLLLPILTKTAATSPTACVRVLWAASIALHVALPHPEGFLVEDSGCPKVQDAKTNYSVSKVGNVFLARECAKTTRETGIVHATFNPGNLRTELQRHWVGIDHWITVSLSRTLNVFMYVKLY
jgi:retinol dehydrogenase-12